MLIRDWMTTEVITVTPDTSMMRVSKVLKDNKIRRVPVVDEDGILVGIVTDRDLKEASPSKATTLDVHELYYLLSEIKVKDIMSTDPQTLSPDDTVERVAMYMNERRIGGLPVVDENKRVVGIITDTDVFSVLVSITGVKNGGVQFGVELPTTEGTLKPVLDALKARGARVASILTHMESDAPTRTVNIRIFPMDRTVENEIVDELKQKFKVAYWARDNVHPITHN